MLIHRKYYRVMLVIFIYIFILILLFLCSGCSCPGSQNLVSPRFYTAIDFMKYDASEHCILSKATEYTSENPYERNMIINEKDEFLFTMKNGSMNYFKLKHHASYEEMRSRYWTYMKYFKKYSSTYYKHKGRPSFTGDYLKWNFSVQLTSMNLQVTARVRELSIR